jgi:hypothetical protein
LGREGCAAVRRNQIARRIDLYQSIRDEVVEEDASLLKAGDITYLIAEAAINEPLPRSHSGSDELGDAAEEGGQCRGDLRIRVTSRLAKNVDFSAEL